MDDQRWPPGACMLFAVAASLALWTVLILVLSATFAEIGESIADGQAAQGARELAGDQVLAQRYTTVAGEVMSLSTYVASGSGTVRMGLYADSGGEAGALLGTTEATAVSASSGSWETFTFASPVPVGDGDYWIAVHADTELGSRGPDAAVVNSGRRIVAQVLRRRPARPVRVQQHLQQHSRPAPEDLDQPVAAAPCRPLAGDQR